MNRYEYKRHLVRDEHHKKMQWWGNLGLVTLVGSLFFAIALFAMQVSQAIILVNIPLFGARLMFTFCCGYFAQSKGHSELWGLWVLFFGFLGFIPAWCLKAKPLDA